MGWFGFQVESVAATSLAAAKAESSSEQAQKVQLPADEPKPTTDASQNVVRSEAPVVISRPSKDAQRFSFQSLTFIRKEHKPALSTSEDNKKREKATEAAQKRAMKGQVSKSNKRAKETALVVRSLIVGPTSAQPKMTAIIAKPELNKIKSQLLEPKTANKLITQLKQLPAHDDPSHINGPIHAVCLAHPDAEEESLHFAKVASSTSASDSSKLFAIPGALTAPLDKLTEMYKEMHIIDLVKSPDLGLGQPPTGNGLLAGAVPTAEAIIQGFEQITPQLLALGYATGKAIVPDHTGIHPPTDRMSVLTYWWGLEILLPPPTLAHLSNAQSIAGAVMNLLSALALVNNGIREILPFIRYISQFIDFEFNSIKSQDQGNGVVCAATWIMPAAMVPRPWDFSLPTVPDKSRQSVDKTASEDHETTPPPAKAMNSLLDVVVETPETPASAQTKSSS